MVFNSGSLPSVREDESHSVIYYLTIVPLILGAIGVLIYMVMYIYNWFFNQTLTYFRGLPAQKMSNIVDDNVCVVIQIENNNELPLGIGETGFFTDDSDISVKGSLLSDIEEESGEEMNVALSEQISEEQNKSPIGADLGGEAHAVAHLTQGLLMVHLPTHGNADTNGIHVSEVNLTIGAAAEIASDGSEQWEDSEDFEVDQADGAHND
uniref:Bestrophin homolog n=1 Tax=Steinernema glaseri TaxID=37863 RepID=A0A1I7YG16_9BILA